MCFLSGLPLRVLIIFKLAIPLDRLSDLKSSCLSSPKSPPADKWLSQHSLCSSVVLSSSVSLLTNLPSVSSLGLESFCNSAWVERPGLITPGWDYPSGVCLSVAATSDTSFWISPDACSLKITESIKLVRSGFQAVLCLLASLKGYLLTVCWSLSLLLFIITAELMFMGHLLHSR